MAAPRHERLMVVGPAGPLEALLEIPSDAEPAAAALVCHPHPLHGGTMDNKVVHTLARAFTACGAAALRFNFRGVGASAGTFDDGRGELADALAAAAHVRARWPDRPFLLGGFSFGAAVATRAAAGLTADALVTVALPFDRLGAVRALPRLPWLLVHGADDALIELDALVGWLDSLPPGPELEVVAGADHFFHGKLAQLRASVEAFVRELPSRATHER
ncbi:MAG TPA: alpha/beta family hydrolase [Gammaproteobacteria bacterium]|nr:alpha/beta family hydrolase [Gammaproteobacteria bacterium]